MKRVRTFGVVLGLLLTTAGVQRASVEGKGNVASQEFIAHLERLIPIGMKQTGVSGIAVGLIEDGQVVWTRGFGWADREREIRMTPKKALNVGSISKTATAWGVMTLVSNGTIDLDAAANRYLKRWKIPVVADGGEGPTVRQLLSHTSGLGLGAVPEYRIAEPRPLLAEAIANPVSGVPVLGRPGEGFEYSGGGYMILQMLVEDVTGLPFERFMRSRVFEPLGMKSTSFWWTDHLLDEAATPYDDGKPVERFVYVGEAAASLNTTTFDLARFAAAALGGSSKSAGVGLLSAETVEMMMTPAAATDHEYGVRYGLGYSLWGIGGGEWVAGHGGQNTGFAAMLWIIPSSGDGIVALTNDSDGGELSRWIHCDWIKWTRGVSWRGYCTDRPDWLPAAPDQRAAGRR